ncbi:MAG: AI-2E family transporter [Hyphomicrobiaceae bacterium]
MTETKLSPSGNSNGSRTVGTKSGSATSDAIGDGRSDALTRASQVSLIGLFIIGVLWCAYVAQPVIVPLLLAWSIATIMLPVVRWLQNRGVPRVAAVLAVTVLLLIVIAALLMVLSAPLTYWLGRAAELAMILKEKLRTISQPLALFEEFRNAISSVGGGAQTTLKVEQQPATAATVFSIVTPAVSQTVLFVGALIFYLVYQKRLRDTAVFLLKDRDARLLALRALSDVDDHMTTFFGTFTVVNICLGLVTAMLTWFVGLPNPLLWGVLAGVLNYVPYVGPAVVTATLAVIGLLTFSTVGEAVVAPLIFLAVVTVEGQFLTPMLMGRRLELNPFAVFLSIAVWTWLWGPIGAFLAVPMLIALSVTLGHVFADTKPELPE